MKPYFECDLMCAAKMSNLSLSDMFFHAPNATKLVFGRVSDPDPAAGAYDAPHGPLVGGGEAHPLPIPLRRRRLDLGAYGASVQVGCQAPNKFLATPRCV